MRSSKVERKTKETEICCRLELDGTGKSVIETGIGFFNHMLHTLSKHSGFDLELSCRGDLAVDTHHSVEDTGIVLGQAFYEALKDKTEICRYQTFTMPMDDALVLCSVDISGRAYYAADAVFTCDRVGEFETQTVDEFFRSFAENARINLHFIVFRGTNAHHIIEAMFKALAKCLQDAVKIREDSTQVLSTKGSL